MDSFFLSETMKYLYLIFDRENPLNHRNIIFSTEAHIFDVKQLREAERYTRDPLPTWTNDEESRLVDKLAKFGLDRRKKDEIRELFKEGLAFRKVLFQKDDMHASYTNTTLFNSSLVDLQNRAPKAC